jgi:hypothetical protein
MKILTYISSLILSGYVYLLFAAYLTVSAGLNSVLPLVSFYSALIIFGFLSWFHFFKPKPGAILLTIFIAIMFFSWPVFLLVENFTGEYKPGIMESGLPLLLSIISIILVWKAERHKDINRNLKLLLASLPLIFALFVCSYFTFKAFF